MVTLHLKRHCIETAARKEFNRLVDTFLDSQMPDSLQEEKIQVLRDFLETSNFSSMRASDPRLSGEIESWVTIDRNSNGTIILKIKAQ